MTTLSSKPQAKLDKMINRLLDLSHQNPQLYYYPSTSKTVEILRGKLNDLFKMMVILGQPCEFITVWKGHSKKGSKKTSKLTDNSLPETSDSESPINTTHQRAIDQKIAHLQLNELVTPLDDLSLMNHLTTLMRKAASIEEERGLPALYLILGLLKWYENPGEEVLSPLCFIPVKVYQENLNSNFQITCINDDVVVNPTLRVKLKQRFNIELPEFGENIDASCMVNFLHEVKALIHPEQDWEIEERVFIDLLMFEKITLYKDLNQHRDAIINHPILRAILEEKGFQNPDEKNTTSNSQRSISYENERSDSLQSYVILDCDLSQAEAIDFAKQGQSLVIQGPPGTGKSQCITNIIAECLAAQRKVLFVAEKKAAIEVVKSRLEKCGLGGFCLEVHSQNTNKADLLKQLESSLDLDYVPQNISQASYHDWELLQESLNRYVIEMNRIRGGLQRSIFDMIGQDLALKEIPILVFEFPNPLSIDEKQLIDMKNEVRNLEEFRTILEDFDRNPWVLSKITDFNESLKDTIIAALKRFLQLNNQLQTALSDLQNSFPESTEEEIENNKLDNPETENELAPEWLTFLNKSQYWIKALVFFDKWTEYEEIYEGVTHLFELEWDRPPYIWESFQQICDLFPEQDKKHLGSNLLTQFDRVKHYLEQVKEETAAFNQSSGLRPILSFEDLQKFLDFFTNFTPQALTFVTDYYITLIKTKLNTKRKGKDYEELKTAVDGIWLGPKNAVDYLDILNQLKSFQEWLGVSTMTPELDEALQKFLNFRTEMMYLIQLKTNLAKILDVLRIDCDQAKIILQTIATFSEKWLSSLDDLYEWCKIQRIRKYLIDHGLEGFFDEIRNRSFPNVSYDQLFERRFTQSWLQEALKSVPEIETFNREFHEKLQTSFIDLDQKLFLTNQIRLLDKLNKQQKETLTNTASYLNEQIGIIRRENKKKRNIIPQRVLFSEIQTLLGVLKPCFMMSPISVAEFLAVEKYARYFDTVIFDEASQISPEDALGTILRGKQLIVVGDSQQMPPTPFFSAKIEDGADELLLGLESMESILDECIGIGFKEKMLRYHYRSRKEGLIAFSNHYFYNNQLLSFPDLTRNSSRNENANVSSVSGDQSGSEYIQSLPALEYRFIKQGVYENRRNIKEAQAIAQAIVDHYQKNQVLHTNYSLGVVAFSQSQQDAIQTELDKIMRSDPSIELLFTPTGEESLFIKNLENVQGDERDFIFFSIGYGPDPQGHIGLNFGPINRIGGYRRLNVAITRARYHAKIFCSFLPSDIHLEKVQAEGLEKLVHYLEFAYSSQLSDPKGIPRSNPAIQHPFEDDVANTIEALGFIADKWIGTSSFKIDIAVVDPTNPGQYILGIECDGGSYGATVVARDRERIRPQVLKGLGWKYYHLWAPEWYHNRNQIIEEITQILQNNVV